MRENGFEWHHMLLRPFSTLTVPKRSVFLCLVSFQAELITLGQKKTLRFGTVEVENGP